MKLPPVYSKTSKNQTQIWEIEVSGGSYRTHEGMLGGKVTTTQWTLAQSKNLGKSNETTPQEQALAEAQAKRQKKIDAGGHDNLEQIDVVKFFEPMTAKKWQDCQKDVKWPVMCQPKLDGMRLIVTKDSMTSRGGKPVVSAPHILEQLRPAFEQFKDLVFDGEMYNAEFAQDFNKIISLAKKQKPTQKDLEESAKKLEYHVYDIYRPHAPEACFKDRIEFLSRVLDLLEDAPNICFVDTYLAKDEEELNRYHDKWIDEGYEGQMVRDPKSKYENKRSKGLLKRKLFQDEEFELVDVLEGVGNGSGRAAMVTCKMKDGKTFNAGMIGDFVYCTDLLKNKASYIGKDVTVCYQNLTPDGVPRIGKMKTIRWDK